MAVLLSSAASGVLLMQNVQAGTATFSPTNRDLTLTFRKVGGSPGPANGGAVGTEEIEVDIGQASTYYNATEGTTIPVANQNATLLNAVFGNDLTYLSWAVGGCVVPFGDNGSASIPVSTLWLTSPRVNPFVPSSGYLNQGYNTQSSVADEIYSMATQAAVYSGRSTFTGPSNAVTSEVIPSGNGYNPGYFLGPFGDYNGNFQGVVENLTQPNFGNASVNYPGLPFSATTPSRSDLYQLEYTGTGIGKYLGYFELETNGTMNFIAGPPPPTLSVSVANNVSTISFQSVGQTTYTLYATNSSGLKAVVTTWAKPASPVIGNGSVESFQMPATATNQFYIVTAH